MSRLIKHLADRIAAAIALVLFSPIILLTAIAVYFNLGRPVIFTQSRPGKDGKIFTFYKFKSMKNSVDELGNPLRDDLNLEQRMTPFGEWIRQTSLDELPQLWNVLKGDMSFVGPRPLVVKYLKRYDSRQARRHEVMPGITGLAQVRGRNALSWDEKFEMDVNYVDNWSLWLDFKILLETVLKVIKKDGINQEGFITSEEFMGSEPPKS